MNLDEYQKLADRTMNRTMDIEKQIINGALGLCGESGELADALKKHLFHGHDFDRKHAEKELGDILWYVATLASTLGIPLEDVAQTNLNKLRARYPQGFDPERSKHRTPSSETE